MRRGEQQRQTWLSVSPFIHQHLKRGTKKLSSVCWDCPFILLAAVVCENTKVSWFLRTPERPGVSGWRGAIFFFLHFTEAYIIFLLSVKQCLLYRILGVGDGKKIKKKTQRVRNKKLVVPNATMRTPPHCRHLVEMQVFRQSGPLKQRPNGNLAESRASGWAFSERMALVKCFVGVSFRERWLLEKNKTHTRTQQQFQVQISLFTRSRRVQLQGRTLGLEHQHP